MARPKTIVAPNLALACDLTAGAIDRLACPPTKQQAFLRDSKVPGLAVRVTQNGAKSFVFERKVSGVSLRRTIGDVRVWSVEAARVKARELAVLIDKGTDPREMDRRADAEKAAAEVARAADSLKVGDVWPKYLKSGRPKRRDAWKPRYRADLEKMASPGGDKKKRGAGLTRPGPLFPLLALPLTGVNEDSLKLWYDSEALAGKHQAARGLMMFRGFLRWCAGRPEYRRLVDREAGKAASIAEALPPNTRRTDCLEAAQVPGWWTAVEQLNNRTASVYLRALLLTGARRQEIASLTWKNIDFRWRKLTLADKIENTRTIPLSPYLAQLLGTLSRTTDHVFAAAGNTGHISDARVSHQKAQHDAGIERLTIHGLRRSFSLLGESAGAPAGAIAQVMGHKPSGTAEGYRPRSIDALRPYLTQIEAHILELAGVKFDPDAKPGKLRAVT